MQGITDTELRTIIDLAREFDAKVASWEEPGRESDADEEMASILEDTGRDTVARDLASLIDSLDIEGQDSLVALAWVGRGTFDPAEFESARQMARQERTHKTSEYLMGIPLLPDLLEEGMEKLSAARGD